MKKEMNNNKDTTAGPENPQSPARRKIIKKAAYIAPTIIVLGVLSPIEAVALPSPPPPPGPSPGPYPGSPESLLYQPQDKPENK